MSDPHYDNVSLLLPMFGDNNGTTFTDYSPTPKTLTRRGTNLPSTSTAQSQYYGSSGLFPTNTSGDLAALQYTSSTALVGSGAFTVGAWMRMTDVSNITYLFDTRMDTGWSVLTNSSTYGVLAYYRGPSNAIAFLYGDGPTRLDGQTAAENNTWFHMEFSRDASGVVRGFMNGNLEINQSGISNNWTSATCGIGGTASVLSGTQRNIQDFYFYQGVALHTESFTPPPRRVGTISGTVTDDTGAPAVRTIYAVPRLAPVRTFGPTTSAADGTYSLTVPVTEHSRIVLDDTAGTNYNDLIDRVIPG